MVMEEEHPMDEPTPKVVLETLKAEEEAKEVPAPAETAPDTPMDEMLSDSKSVRSAVSSKKESPATEEQVEEKKPEDKPVESVETPEVEEEKKEEEGAPAVAPTSEGKDNKAVKEAVEVEKEAEEDKESAKDEAAEVEDVSEEAKRETSKLKNIFKSIKSIKKKVKKMKTKRSSKNKEASPDEVQEPEPNPAEDHELDVPKLVDNKTVEDKLVDDSANPAQETPEEEKEDTDDEAAENEEIINSLRGTVLSLDEENKELKRRIMRMKAQLSGEPQQPFDERVTDTLATKEFENMSPDEKIKQLDSQVQKWQKLYLESNEIGASRIEKLEEGCDEVSTMAKSTSGNTNDDKESMGNNEDRILMLEYQLRESVKVLKTAQKKMVAQHEKEFHLQKTVDDLSEQINELNGQVQKANDSEANMKVQWEQEQKNKLEAEAQLAQERQRLDDFREDLGLAPLYKNEAAVVDDQVDQQIQQTNNSSIFCWGGGSSAQPISQ
ncbi:unnamed protein product [Cylindrotheca closterium]|uniref:Uncharacterized protein n=1 Tax=Cylindrotheca closterium TaxID=2856 RepID=A0AAD2GAA5_9STRA|nr:unnamed protein product [Cylindrotheca closterium]